MLRLIGILLIAMSVVGMLADVWRYPGRSWSARWYEYQQDEARAEGVERGQGVTSTEAFLQLVGLAPFVPPPQFDPQLTQQPEFLPGSEEAQVEAAIVARGWDWHLVRLEREHGIMLLCRRTEPTEMTMCNILRGV